MLDVKLQEEAQKKLDELFAKGPKNAPWMGEPHREEFKHVGLDCLLNRNHMGAWCGYVAVKPGHPAYRVKYMEELLNDVDVHGGLTYSDECQGAICHVPAPGDPDNVWWFGFDCGHCFDIVPFFSIDSRWPNFDDSTYKDINYVRNETKRLAEQLAQMKGAA